MTIRNTAIAASMVFPTAAVVAEQQASFAEQAALAPFSLRGTPTNESSIFALQQQAGDETPTEASAAASAPFGAAASWRWTIQAGVGYDIATSDNMLTLGGVGLSYFLIENVSFNLELNGLFARQIGDNSGGINANLLLRFHMLDFETWSIFGDGGAGVLFTFDDVPAAGSSFNFTPQLGVGASFDIGTQSRLLVGVRWHHISNANTFRANPGRDSLLLFLGLSMPF